MTDVIHTMDKSAPKIEIDMGDYRIFGLFMAAAVFSSGGWLALGMAFQAFASASSIGGTGDGFETAFRLVGTAATVYAGIVFFLPAAIGLYLKARGLKTEISSVRHADTAPANLVFGLAVIALPFALIPGVDFAFIAFCFACFVCHGLAEVARTKLREIGKNIEGSEPSNTVSE